MNLFEWGQEALQANEAGEVILRSISKARFEKFKESHPGWDGGGVFKSRSGEMVAFGTTKTGESVGDGQRLNRQMVYTDLVRTLVGAGGHSDATYLRETENFLTLLGFKEIVERQKERRGKTGLTRSEAESHVRALVRSMLTNEGSGEEELV